MPADVFWWFAAESMTFGVLMGAVIVGGVSTVFWAVRSAVYDWCETPR